MKLLNKLVALMLVPALIMMDIGQPKRRLSETAANRNGSERSPFQKGFLSPPLRLAAPPAGRLSGQPPLMEPFGSQGFDFAHPDALSVVEGQALAESLECSTRLGEQPAIAAHDLLAATARPPDAAPVNASYGRRFGSSGVVNSILNTLGTMGDKTILHTLNQEDSRAAATFTLSSEGRQFFDELFESRVEPKGYLLWFGTTPYGIILKRAASKDLCFFDFFQASHSQGNDPAAPRPVDQALLSLQLLSLERTRFSDVVHLSRTQTPPMRPAIAKRLRQTLGINDQLILLTMDRGESGNHEFLFGPDNVHSHDFQQAISEDPGLMLGKNVREGGVGSGVNAVRALRGGAESFEGSDTSSVYFQLAHWNLLFAVESGQLDTAALGRARIVQGDGLAPLSPGDLYLWNFPSLRNPREYAGMIANEHPLISNAVYMQEQDFVRLFEQVKARLLSSGGSAICRILPSRYKRHVERRAGDDRDVRIIIAEWFLKQSGLSFDQVREQESGKPYPGIFTITSPAAAPERALRKAG